MIKLATWLVIYVHIRWTHTHTPQPAPIANQSIDCWKRSLMLRICLMYANHTWNPIHTIKRPNNLFYNHIFSDKYVMYEFSISYIWVYIRNAIHIMYTYVCTLPTVNRSGHKHVKKSINNNGVAPNIAIVSNIRRSYMGVTRPSSI